MKPGDMSQEQRRRLLLVLYERGKVKPGDLGVSRSYFYMLRHGKRPIPDHIAARLLEIASADELALAGIPVVDPSRIRGLDVDLLTRALVEWARANPASAAVLLETLQREFERLGLTGQSVVRVLPGHLEEFDAYLEARVASRDLDPKTAADYRRYLRRALEELGYVLSPRQLRALIRRLQAEAPGSANHTYKALRLFIREVLGDRTLLEAVPRPRVRWSPPEAPSWEEICRVAELLEPASPARILLLLLASTGLRVQTVYGLSVDALRLEERMVWVWMFRRTKRSYFSFVTVSVADELAEYLSFRVELLAARGVESRKLLPFRPRRLRVEIYRAMDEALGRRFELRLVRKRFAEHLSHYLSSLELAVLMGHSPREVVERHYLLRDERDRLREKYDMAMRDVPCL